MPPSLFISIGDLSGDRAVRPIAELLKKKGWKLYGLTGPFTRGLIEPVARVEDITAAGLFEVIPKLPSILKVKRRVENFIRDKKPDILLLVDAPGFNLPLAKKAKTLGTKKVVYYILPQIWAWKEKRKHILENYCDLLLSVVPFEKNYFSSKRGFFYVGHPSLERLEPFLTPSPNEEENLTKGGYFVVFLGSRKNEVKKHIKIFEKAIPLAVKEFKIPAIVLSFKSLEPYMVSLKKFSQIVYLDKDPNIGYRLIKNAFFGWIKSGTTAFESAILDLPHLTFYRLGRLSYLIAKKLVKVPYIHLANLILEEKVVPELLQDNLNQFQLMDETYRILERKDYLKEHFEILRKLLKPPEQGKTSELVVQFLEKIIKEGL